MVAAGAKTVSGVRDLSMAGSICYENMSSCAHLASASSRFELQSCNIPFRAWQVDMHALQLSCALAAVQHGQVRNAVFQVRLRHDLEAATLVELLQIGLRADANR